MSQLIVFVVLGSILAGVTIAFIFLWRTLQARKAGEPVSDERRERIAGKAARYSMFVTTLATIIIPAVYWAIMVLSNLPMDPLLPISQLAVVLVMAISYSGFLWHLNRKGEFE